MAHVTRPVPVHPAGSVATIGAGRDRLGEHDAGGVGRTLVDDRERVGHRAAEQHALGGRRLGDGEVGGLATATATDAESSVASGSSTSDVTDAVLMTSPGAASGGSVAAIVIARDDPAATVPSAHTTSPPDESALVVGPVGREDERGGEQVGEHDVRGVGRAGVGDRDGERDATAGRRRGAVGDLGDGEVGAARDRRRRRRRRRSSSRVEQRRRRRRHGRVRRRSSPVIPGATVPVIVIRVGGTWRSREIDRFDGPEVARARPGRRPCRTPATRSRRLGRDQSGSVSVTTTSSASELSRSTPFTMSMTPAETAIW